MTGDKIEVAYVWVDTFPLVQAQSEAPGKMGEGRIEKIIRLDCDCISVAGKPVGVRVIFPVYLQLMAGFPSSSQRRSGAEFLH